MKNCSKCGAVTTNHSYCTKCRKEYDREYHKNRIEKRKQETLAFKKSTRDFINEYKNSSKCFCCEESESVCLDFHHLYDKEFSLGAATGRYSIERIKKEIDKCVILCSNCHRKLHAGLIDIRVWCS
jgi:hypothetical protein